MSWGGLVLNPNDIASPCGTIAYTYFNDTFALSQNGQTIIIVEDGISWPGDVGSIFDQEANSQQTQWTNPQSEHFAVWMRTAGLADFSKLWGRIEQTLDQGTYTMEIVSNYNLAQWGGEKYFILTTNSPVGGQNYLLPIVLLIASVACILAVILLILRVK